MKPLLPWQWVKVAGASMSPTLRDGDRLLVRHTTGIRPGDIVLATFRSMPGRHVIKRAAHRDGDGWWLSSDNEFAGGDSSHHGVADVHAKAIARWPARSWLPRRLPHAAAPPSER